MEEEIELEEIDILALLKRNLKDKDIIIKTKRERIKDLKEAKKSLKKRNDEYDELLASYKKLERMYSSIKKELGIPKNHVNQKELSELFSFSLSTLTSWRQRTTNNIPFHQYENNGNIYFMITEVEDWLKRNDNGRQ